MKRLAALLFALAATASAHEIATTKVDARFPGDGTCAIVVRGDASVLLNRLEARAILPRSHRLTAAEIARRLDALVPVLGAACDVDFDGRPAAVRVAGVDVAEANGVASAAVRLAADIPPNARAFTWSYELAAGAYPLAVEVGAKPSVQRVWVDGAQRSAAIDIAAARAPRRIDTFRTYLLLGFTHIVPNGLDHILFVLGIFLLSTRLRDVLKQVTAFTIAHSITLALTMYGVVSLPSRIVEPAIAISIVYIAVENLITTSIRRSRVALVFCFGLLHGMGFAGVLRELGLPHSQFFTALVSFNGGVELGQLAVIATAWLLVASWARRAAWYRWRVLVPASLAIAATGFLWTVQRVLA
jgi:hydrogenase/urease accessory protein HupE